MKKAKLFKNGESQAVRLPKEYRIDGNEVYINKLGNMTFMLPVDNPWLGFLEGLNQFSDDFFSAGRDQPSPQNRESF